jgi:hypothetical protein
MNERIKSLLEQCNIRGIYGITDASFYVESPEKMQEFAELIVRECLDQVDKIRDGFEADGQSDQALGADWAGLAVARHFGIFRNHFGVE